MPRTLVVSYALLVAVLLAAGQVLLKHALGAAPRGAGWLQLIGTAAASWQAWAAVVSTGLAAVMWLRVLAVAELSFVYPMISLSYVFGLLGAALLLDEPVSALRWGGVALVCAGVGLMSCR